MTSLNVLRVTNLTRQVTAAHLRELWAGGAAVRVVFPPCDTASRRALPLARGGGALGGGRRLRSILPLLVRGHASTPTTTDGTMYEGSALRTLSSEATDASGSASVKPSAHDST